MVHVERNIDIEASVERVFEIIDDTSLGVKWNLTANEIKEIEPGKNAIKSTVGDIITTRTETVQNEKISLSVDGGPFSAMGYIISKKGAASNVTLWADFEDEKQEKMLVKAGELLLKSLKIFVEFVESGGSPDEYDKKKMIVSH